MPEIAAHGGRDGHLVVARQFFANAFQVRWRHPQPQRGVQVLAKTLGQQIPWYRRVPEPSRAESRFAKRKERGVKLIGATAHYVTEDLQRRGTDVERAVLSRAVL